MKFCEKLQKLRKEKGYSQEELADLLEVSRQSVSKWESGTTYPEMDKLLSLCKIFGVSLDDLTNDEVSTEKIKEKNQNVFSNLIYTLLEMINKSIEMFKHMDRRSVLRCVMELFVLMVILAIFYLPFDILNNSVSNIFINFPDGVYPLLTSIWLFISNTCYLVLVIAIFIYVYKTRFLDKFDPDEVEAEKLTNENLNKEEIVKAEKIIKPKKERQSFVVFDILGSIFNFFVKMFLFFITIPTIFVFVALVIITVLALMIQFIGIHYISFFIIFLGCSIVCFVIMEVFIRLLFNNIIKFKKSFILFTTGLVISGVGVAWMALEIANTKYIDKAPGSYVATTYETTIKMEEDFMLVPNIYYNAIYEIDEDLKDDIKVSVSYYEEFQTVGVNVHENYIWVHEYTSYDNFRNIWELVKENLQDKECYNYNELSKVTVTITTSSDNIEKLKANKNKRDKEQEALNNRYEYYDKTIESLREEILKKDDKITELEEDILDLEERLHNIQNQFR